MPELDGTSIAALASFAVLVIAWLAAPSRSAAAPPTETATPERAAA